MGKTNLSWMIKPLTGHAESQNQTTGVLLGFVINGNSKGSCCWFIIGFPVNNEHWSLGLWVTNQLSDIHSPVRGKMCSKKSSFYFPLLVFQGLIQHYRRNPDLRCPFHLQLQPQHHHPPHPHPNSTGPVQGEPEMNVIDLVRAGTRDPWIPPQECAGSSQGIKIIIITLLWWFSVVEHQMWGAAAESKSLISRKKQITPPWFYGLI